MNSGQDAVVEKHRARTVTGAVVYKRVICMTLSMILSSRKKKGICLSLPLSKIRDFELESQEFLRRSLVGS